eukprot:gene26275-29681_t
MDGNKLLQSELVQNAQGSEGIHKHNTNVNTKCGTGSNEPGFSMNRAVKFTMVALVMLGILTVTNASPNNPITQITSGELSIESSTSLAESLHFQAPESRKLLLMDTSSVPVCISSTTQLDLSSRDLTEVPDLSACVSLTHIKLNWNPRLKSLPDSLFDLPALRELSIFECGFTSLSPRLGLMPRLRYLDAHENNISVIPAEIASLSTL